jgi:hypothetical protein
MGLDWLDGADYWPWPVTRMAIVASVGVIVVGVAGKIWHSVYALAGDVVAVGFAARYVACLGIAAPRVGLGGGCTLYALGWLGYVVVGVVWVLHEEVFAGVVHVEIVGLWAGQVDRFLFAGNPVNGHYDWC